MTYGLSSLINGEAYFFVNTNCDFPATIEYEYRTPKDSTVINEIKKCVDYCKNALES